MATRSSFLPRLSFSRNDSSLLPFHNSQKPLRAKKSEYDLDELSPRAEDSLLAPERGRLPQLGDVGRARSPSTDTEDHFAPRPSSKPRQRVLFAGPPPPIAKSTLLYRDAEDGGASPSPSGGGERHGPPPPITAARNAISSVLFDRSPPVVKEERAAPYSPDSIWRNLRRRETALQKDLQRLLDIQSAGLSAGLGQPPDSSHSPGPASETGSSSSRAGTAQTGRSLRLPMDRSTALGDAIPVRQPRSKKMGLRAARAGLARSMALLADLKAEEEASLATALGTRKRALAQLRKVSARRDGIADELQSLERDDEEPLTRELNSLGEEQRDVSDQISELEGQLTRLKTRRRAIKAKMDDLNNRRESGLSGYRGALREAEGQLAAMLRQPAVKPLDLEAFRSGEERDGDAASESRGAVSSPGGAEFLRLRSERRTAGMAKEWWEGEVEILEERKREVDKERAALDEGADVWKDVVQLVSDFEADLRRQMAGEDDGPGAGKGKAPEPTPEDRMRAQLDKIRAVVAGLERRLRIVEGRRWNLLVCAVGAELAAFQEAEQMLWGALRAAGFETDDDVTPRLGRSASDVRADGKPDGREGAGQGILIDTREEEGGESDNEVPPDLLMAQEDPYEHPPDDAPKNHDAEKEDSENEVPPEFLAEHQSDGVD